MRISFSLRDCCARAAVSYYVCTFVCTSSFVVYRLGVGRIY
jgi:hypothetical protein